MKIRRHPGGRGGLYLIDTNLYIRAFREPEFGNRFRSWHEQMIGRLVMSVVVLHELLVGATDERRRHLVERAYAGEFRSRGLLLLPSEAVWSKAVAADRTIRGKPKYRPKLDQRSFANDLLIALTCREAGATLITANADDFELIAMATGVRYRTDLPGA